MQILTSQLHKNEFNWISGLKCRRQLSGFLQNPAPSPTTGPSLARSARTLQTENGCSRFMGHAGMFKSIAFSSLHFRRQGNRLREGG